MLLRARRENRWQSSRRAGACLVEEFVIASGSILARHASSSQVQTNLWIKINLSFESWKRIEATLSERWKTRKSLIMRARNADDSHAWEEFVQYYERFIFHVLHRMKVSVNDFDDLVQNVLLKLWKSLASYDSEKARFRTWLGVVIRNAVYDQFTETKRRRELLEKEQESLRRLETEPKSEVERLIEQEWAQYVTQLALTRIKKIFSEEAVASFSMSHDGVPAKEIAAKLNLTVDSVYTLKSRVKSRFIKEIKAVIDELEG